ncbi:MAG: helix-turn-helix domain-containing protein [Gemmatimonadota bacterium]
MPRPVKVRPYHSPLRVDQAQVTRTAIVDAATALFSERGFAAVSIDAIAAAAGVSRATVFTSIGGKAAILDAAFRAAFGRAAGKEEASMPFVERPRSRKVRSLRGARAYLAGYAALVTKVFAHVADVYEAIREGSRADADVGALWLEINEERRRGADTIVADVRARGSLRRGLDEKLAADVVWVLNDPGIFHMFVRRRRWSAKRYEEWLVRALASELLDADA